jgi:hypothetical protein
MNDGHLDHDSSADLLTSATDSIATIPVPTHGAICRADFMAL